MKIQVNCSVFGNYKIEYDTIANQKEARYNMTKKPKAAAMVREIVSDRFSQGSYLYKPKGRRNAAFPKYTS